MEQCEGDFNGDDLVDLLWRHSTNGQNVIWLMDGTSLDSLAWQDTVADTDWEIVDVADFDQDNDPDILWHHATSGQNVIWVMDGTAVESYAWLETVADTNWRIAGLADFDQDNDLDILWRHSTTGQNVIWVMNETSVDSYVWLETVGDTFWEIIEVGDFDQDNDPDILWRHATSGQNVIWVMDGTSRSSYAWLDAVADINWEIKEVADFDTDGDTDILWRHATSGQNVIWVMNGTSLDSYAWLETVTDINWKIIDARDYDQDGDTDILWRHASEGKARYDDRSWEDATATKTVQGFEDYLRLNADGKHVAEAKDNIEFLHWQEATATNTIRAYQHYSITHPGGQYVLDAETYAAALRNNKALFDAALKVGTEASLKSFLEDFPGHQKEAEARKAIKDLTEGRDIFDLLCEKKIEIETQGSGIQSVGVRIRKLVPYPITVRLPVGSYFVSSRQSAQNMVTTAESKVHITGDDWRRVSVSAACANRPRDIPGSGDTFSVQRSPHQKELERLIPVLEKAGTGYATRQAAVWIVTDNASYSDLGILVSRSQFQAFGGTRTIRETETAQAMRICTDAGIDITRKRIWNDRERILKGLGDAELKKWLEERK